MENKDKVTRKKGEPKSNVSAKEEDQRERERALTKTVFLSEPVPIKKEIFPGTSGPAGVTLTGLMGPGPWLILGPNGALYRSGDGSGWAVSANGPPPTILTVTVPSNAPSGSYEVRWSGSPSGFQFERYSGTFPVP